MFCCSAAVFSGSACARTEGETQSAPKQAPCACPPLNTAYQAIAQEELNAALAAWSDEKSSASGCLLLVEPRTGTILGLAGRNAGEARVSLEGGRMFASQFLYEPGSTFQIVAAAAAVDSGKATFDTLINCDTCRMSEERSVSDRPRVYKNLTVADVLKKSSSPGTFRIAQLAGLDTYREYLERFGFSAPAGLDETPGMKGLNIDERGDLVLSRMSIGYTVRVNPLQMAMAYAAIANDGVRVRPRSASGEKISGDPAGEGCRVMSPETARGLRAALARAIEPGGTAHRAAVEGLAVAGKTGTAHRIKATGGYEEDSYTVSFAGILPAGGGTLVCLVVIDNPSSHNHPGGGTVCAPVFQKVAARLAGSRSLAAARDSR